jgi:hypothetical protein
MFEFRERVGGLTDNQYTNDVAYWTTAPVDGNTVKWIIYDTGRGAVSYGGDWAWGEFDSNDVLVLFDRWSDGDILCAKEDGVKKYKCEGCDK